MVPQGTFIFNDTVADNVTLGADLPVPRIWRALRLARAEDFVRALPDGLDTRVGERGTTLSGGQRQRLALARELLRNPDLFIFDEPTSALDQETEAIIGELLNELSHTHPVIIISHRPDVIFGASVIYRVEQGKAVQMSLPEFVKASRGAAS
jgi:ATP-binding cassette subfamily B protein